MDTLFSYGKLYKFNPLIQAKYIKKDKIEIMSINTYAIFSRVLFIIQKQIRDKSFVTQGDCTIEIPEEYFKGIFGNHKDWRTQLKEKIDELASIQIKFEKIKLPLNTTNYAKSNSHIFGNEDNDEGYKTYSFYTTNLFNSVSKVEGSNLICFQLNHAIAYCIWCKLNYTGINLKATESFVSKFTNPLFEFIEYYLGINKINNKPVVISIDKEKFQALFNINPKKDEPLSRTLFKINRDNNLIKDLKKIYSNFKIENKKSYVEISFKEKRI